MALNNHGKLNRILRSTNLLTSNGEVVGIRFGRGFEEESRSYVDVSLETIEKHLRATGKAEALKDFKSCTLTDFFKNWHENEIFHLSTLSITYCFVISREAENSKIDVVKNFEDDENGRFKNNVTCFNNGLFTRKIPYFSPIDAKRLIDTLDSVLYGTDFIDLFKISSMNECLKSVWNVTNKCKERFVLVKCLSCFSIEGISKELLHEKIQNWMDIRSISYVDVLVEPLNKIYRITLTFSMQSIAPIIFNPIFAIKEQTLPDNSKVYYDGKLNYFLGTLTLEQVGGGSAISSRNTIDKVNYPYLFSRLLFHNGRIYSLSAGNEGSWFMWNVSQIIPTVSAIVEKVVETSILNEVLTRPSLYFPKVERDIIRFDFDISIGDIPVTSNELSSYVYETLAAKLEKNAWDNWNWENCPKNFTPSVKVLENNKLVIEMKVGMDTRDGSR